MKNIEASEINHNPDPQDGKKPTGFKAGVRNLRIALTLSRLISSAEIKPLEVKPVTVSAGPDPELPDGSMRFTIDPTDNQTSQSNKKVL